jgi:ATP-dependent RNA helicase RhlE
MPFQSLGLPEPIIRGVRAAGYTDPTPVQRESIPVILAGHDLVVASQTGSGKTAAFLLPILTRLLRGPKALRALILVPTRELAAQVEECARDYARFTSLRGRAVYGGVPIGPQERMLRQEGVDLLVATPGRLLDLDGRQSLSLDEIEVLVLDEADRMVDMGFAPDLKRILRLLPRKRQTLMFSATMPPALNTVARDALSNPERLDLAPSSRPAASIEQAFYPVPRNLKGELLDQILRREPEGTALVFARTKRGAERLGRQLQRRGHSVAILHGDRSQSQRERALLDLRRGRIAALVATDIASRGIDVDLITHVVNFDVPRTPEDYIHRIGRTGRMNAAGDALTLVSPEERKEADAIERFLGRTVPRVKMMDFDYQTKAPAFPAGEGAGGGRRGAKSPSRGEAPIRRSRPPGAGTGRSRREPASAAVVSAAGAGASSHGRRPRPASMDRRSRKRL